MIGVKQVYQSGRHIRVIASRLKESFNLMLLPLSGLQLSFHIVGCPGFRTDPKNRSSIIGLQGGSWSTHTEVSIVLKGHLHGQRLPLQPGEGLQKIDRVTFGIMTDEQVPVSDRTYFGPMVCSIDDVEPQVRHALAEQPLMPLTRSKLAIPFVGATLGLSRRSTRSS